MDRRTFGWMMVATGILPAVLQLPGCQATRVPKQEKTSMPPPASQPKNGIQIAIVKKPDLKVMGLAHEGLPPDQFFSKFPPQTWGRLTEVSGRVSGTRGYMFKDRDLARQADEFHTVGVEVLANVDKPLAGTFLKLVPASAYAVFYREPGARGDVFAASKKWRDERWKANPDVTVQSYDDHEGVGFFLFVPIIATSATPVLPEIPGDPIACYAFIKAHGRPVE